MGKYQLSVNLFNLKKILSTKRENMLDPIQKDLHQKCNDITPLSHVTMEK